jgi:hypothetical protein
MGNKQRPCQFQIPTNRLALDGPWLGTEAKPKADQGQSEKYLRRTLLKSAIIFHTLASSNRGKVRPYSQRKWAKLPNSHNSVWMYRASSCSQLSMYASTFGCRISGPFIAVCVFAKC